MTGSDNQKFMLMQKAKLPEPAFLAAGSKVFLPRLLKHAGNRTGKGNDRVCKTVCNSNYC